MRNLKKVLSLSLALVMLIGMMVVGAGAAKFDDVADGADKQEAIEVMNAIEIIKGDAGSSDFRPTDTLTRAEAAVIISKVLFTPAVVEKLVGMDTTFTDMAGYEWAIPYVQACANSQVINGTGDNKFEPGRKVTGVEFAAMLMRVLGINDSQFTNWDFEVQQKAIEMKLDTNGVVISAADLNRQDAAQMAFNALMYSPSGTNGYKIVGGTPATTVVFSSVLEAILYQNTQSAPGTLEVSTANDTLAATRFNLTIGAAGQDAFGRTTKVWNVNGKKAVELSGGDAAVTYTAKKAAAEIAKELEGYTVAYGALGATTVANMTDSVDLSSVLAKIMVKNGAAAAALGTAAQTPAAAIEALTGNGKVVEIYADSAKKITKVVVVEYTVGELAITTAKNGDVTYKVNAISGIDYASDTKDDTVELHGGVEEGDYVTYAKAGTVLHLYPTERVDGVMTAYADAAKTITIEGTVYTLATGVSDGTDAVAMTDFSGNLGKAEITYYVDQYGFVVANSSPSAAPSGDFAYVLVAEGTPGAGATLENPAAGDFTVKVRAALADGTVGIYNVKLTKAPTAVDPGNPTSAESTALTKAQTDSGIAGLGYGDYYTAGVIVWDASEGTDAARNKASALSTAAMFGYKLSEDGKTLTLEKVTAAAAGDMTAGVNYVNALTANYEGGNTVTATKSALVTNDTTFVVISNPLAPNAKAAVYTGKLPLGPSKKLESSNTFVVMNAANASTGVATVVFTTADIGTETAKDAGYAYVDITTATTSLGADNKPVTSYTGVTAGGEVTLIAAKDVTVDTTGVWAYNEKNEITGTVKTSAVATVIGSQITGGGESEWLNLTLDTQYVYVDETLADPNGNICVVIKGAGPNAANAEYVFIISEVPPCDHSGSRTTHPAGDASAVACTAKATKAYYTCDACGMNFQAATGTDEATAEWIANGVQGTKHTASDPATYLKQWSADNNSWQHAVKCTGGDHAAGEYESCSDGSDSDKVCNTCGQEHIDQENE